ncbi:MAG: esterase/lipase family protein [Akkermansiaceae bacterium]
MRTLLILASIVILTQCGAPSPPKCRFLSSNSRTDTNTLLKTAEANWKVLADPGKSKYWPDAQQQYNQAVAELFDQLRCGKPSSWEQRAESINTSLSSTTEDSDHPSRFNAIFPASLVEDSRATEATLVPGVGIPAVGWLTTTPIGIPRPAYFPPNGQPRNATVLLDFDSHPPQWQFKKRWIKDEIKISGTKHALAANWSAPIDFFWHMCELDNLRIQNALIPDRFTEETGLFFFEPYDPTKIPVVMVHGLVSSPDAFREIINELSPEPWFREKYQVWLYNYPTGTPWLFSAMKFRQAMNQAIHHAASKGPTDNLDKMVILSHSMGGLITRSSVSHPQNYLYDAHFKTPFDQLRVRSEARALIKDGLLYEPIRSPARVVFMAVPHQGSPMATFRGTGLLSKIIRLPKSLTVGLLDATLKSIEDRIEGQVAVTEVRPPTSISSLSPSNPANIGLKSIPLPEHIIFHSIIGDKGDGDTPDSSDGVVPYWSSHIGPVASELIVPSNHSVPSDPQATAEVERILKLNLAN